MQLAPTAIAQSRVRPRFLLFEAIGILRNSVHQISFANANLSTCFCRHLNGSSSIGYSNTAPNTPAHILQPLNQMSIFSTFKKALNQRRQLRRQAPFTSSLTEPIGTPLRIPDQILTARKDRRSCCRLIDSSSCDYPFSL